MPTPSAAPAAPRAERVVNPNYLKLWFGLLFFMVNINCFNLLPYYLELRGASPDLYGQVAGALGISNVIALVLLGSQADRWSRKTTVSAHFVAAFAGNLLAIWAMGQPSLHWYYGVRLLHGIFIGLAFPLVYTWAVEVSPPRMKHLALAWLGIGAVIANSLGPTLGELLISLLAHPKDPGAYRWVWVMGLAFEAVALGFFLSARNVHPAAAEEGAPVGLWPLMRRPQSLLVLLVGCAFGGMFGVLMSFSKNYTASLGLDYVSVLLWAYTAGAVLSRVFLALILRAVPERHMVPLGLLGVGGSFLLLGGGQGYGLLSAAGFLYGLSHGVLFPTLYVRFLDLQRPSEAGRAATIFQGAFSVGWGLAPMAAGTLVRLTNFATVFSLAAALSGIAILLHLRADLFARERGVEAPAR